MADSSLERDVVFFACNNIYDLFLDSLRSEVGHYYDEQELTRFIKSEDVRYIGNAIKYYSNPDVKAEFIYKCTGQEAMDKYGDIFGLK